MKTIFKLSFLVGFCFVVTPALAQIPQSFFESFANPQYPDAWVIGNNGTGEIRDGRFVCDEMTLQSTNSKYRADLKYNNVNNNPINEDYYFSLNPEVDRYLAIKFAGKRPDGVLKFEMKSENDTWFNTKWNGGNPSSISTGEGNHIYYFDLTADDSYVAGGSVIIRFFNFIIADAAEAPYEYAVEWIGTFTTLGGMTASAGFFESFTNPHPDTWILGNDGAGGIRDGRFVCDEMTLQDNGKYRADLKYNNTNNNPISEEYYFSLNPEIDRYLAVKFTGRRPEGALKLEMRAEDNSWFNTRWNGGNPSSISTSAGDYIYYFDLTADDSYVAGGPVIIKLFNFIIADAAEEPYEYAVDWIGVFESPEMIETFKDATIIEGNAVSALNDWNDVKQLILYGDWQEKHFNLLETALAGNSTITSIDISSVTIPTIDFLSGMDNLNCLLFIAETACYPNWINVIQGNSAENIKLTDGYPFNSPKEFAAASISYTRKYTTEGWASLCLPFDINVSDLPEGVTVYEFVNAEGTAITFNEVEEGVLTANTPYIANISDIEDAKVFAVDQVGDIIIPSTGLIEITKGDYVFKGSFEEIRPAQELYLLGSDGLGFGVGTDKSYVPPFRSYLENVNHILDTKYLTLGIGDGETTSISLSRQDGELILSCFQGELMIITDRTQTIEIYSVDGRLVKKAQLHTGENRINGLSEGIYFLNNQKVVLN